MALRYTNFKSTSKGEDDYSGAHEWINFDVLLLKKLYTLSDGQNIHKAGPKNSPSSPSIFALAV